MPDFSEYRHEGNYDSETLNKESLTHRYILPSAIAFALGLTGAYMAKSTVTAFAGTLSASKDVLALAKIEIKLAEIPEGRNVTFKWRGNNVCIQEIRNK